MTRQQSYFQDRHTERNIKNQNCIEALEERCTPTFGAPIFTAGVLTLTPNDPDTPCSVALQFNVGSNAIELKIDGGAFTDIGITRVNLVSVNITGGNKSDSVSFDSLPGSLGLGTDITITASLGAGDDTFLGATDTHFRGTVDGGTGNDSLLGDGGVDCRQ
jgi:Ca2+-binding RTX toxin-like protein